MESPFSGKVELRGLADGVTYRVVDYENSRKLATVTGPSATLEVDFRGHLLVYCEESEAAGRSSRR